MDYSNDYIDHDKSSLMDDSDEACSIPGSFSPDSGQDGASGDQRFVRQVLIRLKSFAIKTHKDVKDIFKEILNAFFMPKPVYTSEFRMFS